MRIPIELLAKVRTGATKHSMTVSEYARYVIAEKLDKQPLTLDDVEWIKSKIENNRRKRHGH